MNCNYKKTIICVVGPSGSGKTTMGMFLCEHEGYNWICSYTTRSMRDGEIDGLDHWFVSEDDVPSRSEMLAYGIFGGKQYWATFDQFVEDVPNVYIIDEKSLLEMEKRLSPTNDYNLIKVYVKRDITDVDSDRINRDSDRKPLPESFYDLILDNNSKLDDFLFVSANKIRNLINKI